MGALLLAPCATGCDTPSTYVVLDNDYPRSAERPLVVYDAFWQAAKFTAPIPPGSSSDLETTISASANTAYVLLAPGWIPDSSQPPAEYVLLQSRDGFAVHINETLHIPVDDATFAGNCAAGSHLSQEQADFMSQIVFIRELGELGQGYDASTCTVTGSK